MIIFIDEELEVDGITHWLNVSSAYQDLVVFEFGLGNEPVNLKDSEDSKRYLAYAIFGEQLVDIKAFSYTGVKASWMGKENSILAITPSGDQRHIWLDFDDENDTVKITGGYFSLEETKDASRSFSYFIPKRTFHLSADHMLELYTATSK